MNKTRKTVQRSEDVLLLAKFVGEGDEDAFAQIVRKYEPLVWNICCRILHNRCDAEDAFQSTFLLLATKAGRIRKPKSLSSWLYGVAFRTASSIRKQRQRGMLPYENSLDMRLTEDVLEQVARKNENELVSAEIMLMKEKHKTPLLMFYFLGNSTSQIAQTLGLTVSAVEGRLRQAKRTLKLQLRMQGINVDDSFAALILPVMVVSPSLTYATISNALAASMASGAACLLSKISIGSNQIGARLMLMKIAVSFGLVCVTSAGLLHHGSFHCEQEQVTQVAGCECPLATATVAVKFVQDEDEGDEPAARNRLIELHDHLYGFYQHAKRLIHGEDEPQRLHLRVQALHELEFRVVPSETITELEGIVLNVADVELGDVERETTQAKTAYRVLLDEENLSSEGHELTVEALDFELLPAVEVHSTVEIHPAVEVHSVPFLSNIPYIGRLFSNGTKEQEAGITLEIKPVLTIIDEVETSEADK